MTRSRCPEVGLGILDSRESQRAQEVPQSLAEPQRVRESLRDSQTVPEFQKVPDSLRCPEVGLGNPDSTSERSQKVKSRKRKPTSGHQERPAKVVDRKKRRRQKEDANNVFEHIQTMQIHCVFVGFKHIATFEAISTNTTVNGTGARSTFQKFT